MSEKYDTSVNVAKTFVWNVHVHVFLHCYACPDHFVLSLMQKFHILPVDFSIPGGELTPTMKMKRKVILAKYHDIVSDMYKES